MDSSIRRVFDRKYRSCLGICGGEIGALTLWVGEDEDEDEDEGEGEGGEG